MTSIRRYGYDVLKCEANAAQYDCVGCKGFKGIGICSHVVAVNHILKKFNVRAQLRQLTTSSSRSKSANAGNRKKPVPALTRLPVPDMDSSDEEAERLQALGELGR